MSVSVSEVANQVSEGPTSHKSSLLRKIPT